MQVIFIHHSCFLVEIDDRVLIFDYFDGDRVRGYHFTGKLPTYAPETKIYMFASHSHADHYDMDILRLADQYPNITYILSKDIRISPNFLKKHGIDPKVRDKVVWAKPDTSFKVDDMKITTYHSTDAGVAYYVDCAGVSLFHSGDLYDWTFDGVGELTNGHQARDYRFQIRKLSLKPINIAFVPMDPRLESHQFDGFRFFLETSGAEYIFPMHMWQDYSGIKTFKGSISNSAMADRVMEIERENQVFVFGESK